MTVAAAAHDGVRGGLTHRSSTEKYIPSYDTSLYGATTNRTVLRGGVNRGYDMPSEKEVPQEGRGQIWKPTKPGDKIVGEMTGVRDFTGGEFGASKIMDFRTNDGEKSVFADSVLKKFVPGMTAGKVYKLTFLGWGRDYGAKRTAKNRYRQWKVTELVK